MATFEPTRYAKGRRNLHTFEINGEKGAISLDLETVADWDGDGRALAPVTGVVTDRETREDWR